MATVGDHGRPAQEHVSYPNWMFSAVVRLGRVDAVGDLRQPTAVMAMSFAASRGLSV
jgi:hypothetical protein